MKIYVLRHGQTPWNVERRLQGRSDTELNENGREAARITGEAFQKIPFDLVFTSPLKRARQTAELFLGERNVPILEEERIIEISFGDYEGLSCARDHYQIPDQEFLNFFDRPECYRTPPHGESLEELGKRTKEFMEELFQRKDLEDKTVLLSSHGCATRGILNSIRIFSMEDFWHGGVPKNCSVALIEVEKGIPRLIYENRTFYREDPAKMAKY